MRGLAKEFKGDEDELDGEQEPKCRGEAAVDGDSVPEWLDTGRGYGKKADPDLEEEDGAENQIACREGVPDELGGDEPIEPLNVNHCRAGEKEDSAISRQYETASEQHLARWNGQQVFDPRPFLFELKSVEPIEALQENAHEQIGHRSVDVFRAVPVTEIDADENPNPTEMNASDGASALTVVNAEERPGDAGKCQSCGGLEMDSAGEEVDEEIPGFDLDDQEQSGRHDRPRKKCVIVSA